MRRLEEEIMGDMIRNGNGFDETLQSNLLYGNATKFFGMDL